MTQHQMPADFIIRRADRADVPQIVRLLADDPAGGPREVCEAPLPQAYYAAFDAIQADAANELVVAEQAGEVIGTLQLTFIPCLNRQGGKRAQVEAVQVDARHRGQGVGGRLLAWVIARARDEGCRLVQLTSSKNRADAHRFYARLGFVATHEGMKLDLSDAVSPKHKGD